MVGEWSQLSGSNPISALGLDKPERLVAVSLQVQELKPLVASGRLPKPGQLEVLAGPLARLESFDINGIHLEVVGRLQGSIPGFAFAYLMPWSKATAALFDDTSGASQGTLFIDGMIRSAALRDAAEAGGETIGAGDVEAGRLLVPPYISWGTILGMLLVAIGGSWAHIRFFRWYAFKENYLPHVLQSTLHYPRLLVSMHVLLYAVFFGAMLLGQAHPLWNMRMMDLITMEFTEGDLSYVGDAYMSGNIFNAALMTFINNFVVQTLGLTYIVSFFIPLAPGVLKTALSFALVGFGSSPIWSGTSAAMIYHSITMVLELEAYILASFVVVLWPVHLAGSFIQQFQRINPPRAKAKLIQGLCIFGQGIVLSAVMLVIAALYEAATLISFR
jgi:hypothetical protein